MAVAAPLAATAVYRIPLVMRHPPEALATAVYRIPLVMRHPPEALATACVPYFFFGGGVTEVTSLYQTWRFLGLGQTMNIYVKQKYQRKK